MQRLKKYLKLNKKVFKYNLNLFKTKIIFINKWNERQIIYQMI
jgi:hypothetical protein